LGATRKNAKSGLRQAALKATRLCDVLTPEIRIESKHSLPSRGSLAPDFREPSTHLSDLARRDLAAFGVCTVRVLALPFGYLNRMCGLVLDVVGAEARHLAHCRARSPARIFPYHAGAGVVAYATQY